MTNSINGMLCHFSLWFSMEKFFNDSWLPLSFRFWSLQRKKPNTSMEVWTRGDLSPRPGGHNSSSRRKNEKHRHNSNQWETQKTGKKSHQHITARPAFTVSVRLCINVKTVIGSFTLRQYLIAARDLDTHRQSGGKCWNQVIPSGTSPEIWHLTVRV